MVSVLYPYRMGSRSATALSRALGIKQVRHEGSRFRGSARKTCINWGASELPEEVRKCSILNRPSQVAIAANKRSTFDRLAVGGIQTPEYTTSQETVRTWLENGFKVVARKVLTGHSGAGIVILERGDELEPAPLYTKYVPKSAEYRVHVFRGEVIDVQRKVKDPDRDVIDWNVRSHDNGFIFVRNNDAGASYMNVCEEAVKGLALSAVRALELDFGAVDIVYNSKKKAGFVLEVNTACGLEGHSVEVYANAFRRVI